MAYNAPTAGGDWTTASGMVVRGRPRAAPPMPPPAPPRAPAQQTYASANPNASFQRAPAAMARPPMPPVATQRSTAGLRPMAMEPQSDLSSPQGQALLRQLDQQGTPRPAGSQLTLLARPAGPAYANANPNASFQQNRQPLGAPGPYDPTAYRAMPQPQVRNLPAGGVTAADMVDVPGFGPMPRSLLTAVQSRMQQRQQPAPQPMPAQGPLLPNRVYPDGTSNNMARYAPPVRAMPAPGPVDTRYRPYGNDNVGVGVPQPSPVTTPAPPPPPPVAAPSPFPTTPEPGAPGNHWWNAQTGQWVAIDRAAEAAARNNAMVPPTQPASPILPWLAGGGPEAFGAGRSPVATSMTDFYGAFGSGIPGQPVPTQQQIYDRFNANANQNPYQITGAVNNGNTVFPGPSWY